MNTDSQAAIDDPLLTRVDVFFRTNDDDKDYNTDLKNEIHQQDNTGAWANRAFAEG
jgi:hypothetical protein